MVNKIGETEVTKFTVIFHHFAISKSTNTKNTTTVMGDCTFSDQILKSSSY